jgi:eukaryotic-like serine/threonine-protein kinase
VTLAAGSRLGPYEIVSPLGAGGMGEVYKARDTRLERTVAVKVLPQRFSSSLEVRQRFEREAKTISQLSHPHICALYDVGREGETEYLVMELLEGETLSDRLAKGPLPLEQTLRFGVEIADALDKAHRQGIVHRDLKPANVMITKSGVKLLDFGLAKAMAPAGKPSSLTALPTQQGLTQEGTILGTFQYMAPEQLEGKDADARTDIFAFGAVLYEMATGKKAFSAASQASLITAIMSLDPPAISAAQPMSPPALDRVVKKCLAKDPEDRWQSAGDLRSELKWIGEAGSQAGAAAPVVASRRRRLRLSGIAAAGFAVVAAALAAALLARRPAALPVIRASILAPEGADLISTHLNAGPVEISPDGTRLVFTARKGEGPNLLWVRDLSEPAARPLAGTEGAERPFWSPDGRFIGFFADRALKKIPVGGGPVFRLAEASESRGGTWNREGIILYTPDARGPVYSIPAAGGKPAVATVYDEKKDTTHRYPRFLPDGRHFLYLLRHSGAGAGDNPEVRVGSLDSKESKLVLNVASNAVVASGYLLYVREGALVAQRFDSSRLEVRGEPAVLAPDVLMDERFSRGVFSASDGGVLVYQTGKGSTESVLRWIDRDGRVLSTVGEPAEYFSGGNPEISPDGARAAASIVDLRTGDSDVWTMDLASGVRSRFTAGRGDKWWPVWSPDGKRIAYSRAQGQAAGYDVILRDVDGPRERVLAQDSRGLQMPTSFSPDGRFLLFERRRGQDDDVWALRLDGEPTPRPVAATPGFEALARVSPNGRYVAYMSDESGRFDIFVTTFPEPGGRWQVSQGGGVEPRWSKDGRELFFFAPDNRMMAAEVKTETGNFEVGAIHPLFQSRLMGMSFRYDVSKDGKRFLVNGGLPQTISPITLVTNWTAELEKKP